MTTTLIDPRFGPLTEVAPLPQDPGLPSSFVCVRARVADTRRFATWSADPVGWGSSLGDHDSARRAAIGEAVERYCGHAVPPGLRRGTTSAVRDTSPVPVLDPAELALFSQAQYLRPGFPFVRPIDSVSLEWVLGTDLVDARATWLPAATVYLDHRQSEAILPSSYTGIATGAGRTDAETRAILEIVERDAVAIWWASGASARGIDAPAVAPALLGPSRLRTTFLEIPSQFPIPVVAAVVTDPEQDLLAVGCAARPDAQVAAEKALVEALGGLRLARQLADPDSETWRSIAEGQTPRHIFLPFRADRRHLDDAGDEYRNLPDLPGLAQLAQDARYRALVQPRLQPDGSVPLKEIPSGPAEHGLLLEAITDAGMRAYSVDLTTSDIRSSGLSVVRVVVPGMIGNAPPAFPLMGGQRLLRLPHQLGFDQCPSTAADLFRHPFPLA